MLEYFVDGYCVECSGALTRSPEYTPQQPRDSNICAACWYNKYSFQKLITTEQLDDYFEDGSLDHSYIGRMVDWHGYVFPLVRCADLEIRVMVLFVCGAGNCKRVSEPFYAGSGLHHGAWCYIYDFSGKYLANWRDQDWVCEFHES